MELRAGCVVLNLKNGTKGRVVAVTGPGFNKTATFLTIIVGENQKIFTSVKPRPTSDGVYLRAKDSAPLFKIVEAAKYQKF